MKVHQIRIDFNVTEEIKRYVYVYLIEGENCYLIDSGVAGCQDIIIEELHSIGKDISDIKGIFLTHAHPDHIGTAAWFKERTGCRVYAGAGEKPWIEDIDLQFAERPIPNFYKLAGKSVQVDCVLHDGDEIALEKDITLKAVSTPGHSAHEMSFQIGSYAFIGDCIPVKGDIPIYIDKHVAIDSIKKIKNMTGVDVFYPAWDTTYLVNQIDRKSAEGIEIIEMIEQAVQRVKTKSPDKELSGMVCEVCRELEMPWLAANPLFARTVQSHLKQ
ncbi:MAG: MBL fold metallo-hydrolase [Lachnospiraceae bacterium]